MRRFTTRLAVAGVLLAVAGCGDLTVEPKSDVTSANLFTDPNSYRGLLAKLYGGLVVTGQSGPDGNPDILGIDEGFSQYMRVYWQFQELPTDEAIIGWGDPGLPVLNTQQWSSSNPWVNGMYSRIFYQIAVINQFLRDANPDTLTRRGASAALQAEVAGYRNEARFLRALSYYHAVDLFGNVPLVDENFPITQLPRQATRTEVFSFVESELKAVRGALPATSTGANYGRASKAAVDMVLAKLYLNAQVYTGTARWADAKAAAAAVIAAPGLTLDPNYQRMFLADNNTSPEMIFTVPQDGTHTRTWGGMTYLVHAPVGGSENTSAFGIDYAWWGLRLRQETVNRYATGDQRAALIYTSGQSKSVGKIDDFSQGYLLMKYRNVTSTGATGSDLTFPDIDFPMFRLADAYLMFAEAVLRGGGSSADSATALGYVNAIRARAFGGTSGNITLAQMTLPFILDERNRELTWEGHRRQDLIRFGQFSDQGIWQWKNNDPAGTVTAKYHDLYPIPTNELSANPNVKQNPGY